MANQNRSGYILILTLSIIGLCVALVTYMVNNGRVFVPFARTMIEREKARMLAMSGIEIARSQLALNNKSTPEANDTKGAPASKKEQEDTLFSFVLPRLNIWQKFKLTPSVEGINGEIAVCIMSEEGKLNLNELFDSATGDLIQSIKSNAALVSDIQGLFERIEKMTGGKDLYKAYVTFLKNRHSKLDDVTELLTIKEFDVFRDRIFYEPPEMNKPHDQKDVYLTDIFTLWSGKKNVDPWLLSDSMRGILQLSRVEDGGIQEKRKTLLEVERTMPDTLSWPNGWNTYLKLVYGKDFAILPKGIEALFDTRFEPVIFSVLCYGKVGKTTQKLFAILERAQESTEKDKQAWSVTLKKLYWI